MLASVRTLRVRLRFLHLGDGRLFRLETEPAFPSTNAKETEYFWGSRFPAGPDALHFLNDVLGLNNHSTNLGTAT
jgi:hypothetical protein